MKRRVLFELVRGNCHGEQTKAQIVYGYLNRNNNLEDIVDEYEVVIRNRIQAFLSNLNKRWLRSNRILDRFLRNNESWLETEIDLLTPAIPVAEHKPSTSIPQGRPCALFEELSDRSKRRRTRDLRNSATPTELTYAAAMSLREIGQGSAAKLVKDVLKNSPSTATACTSGPQVKSITPYTPDEALSLFLRAKLTKEQYQIMRLGAVERNADMYPRYKLITEAKKRCYPPEETITVTDQYAAVQLQALLDHTVRRILDVQEPVLETLLSTHQTISNLMLVSKWGFDGSSGHSKYKQMAPDSDFDDGSMFVTFLVPLQLYLPSSERKLVVWQNTRSSSTGFCRPIKFEFAKETTDLTRTHSRHIQEEIVNLVETHHKKGELDISVSHQLHLTMLDTKAINALTSSSSQSCYLCGAKPTNMNNIDVVLQMEVNPETLKYGLSPLHCWIRCFECMLHISYKLDTKKWRSTPTDKVTIEKRKREIQLAFKERLGLTVDQPKQGFGTSNDGNTARRFFQYPHLSAEITGLNENLIERLATILRAVSSDYEINVVAFRLYCLDTAKEYVDKYGWYSMPVTLHKLLIHGSDIISASPLPIGCFSEEPQEARNKECKRFRELHARKMNRTCTNEDILHLLLCTSDPLITSMRKQAKRKAESFPLNVLALLESCDSRSITRYQEVDETDESDNE